MKTNNYAIYTRKYKIDAFRTLSLARSWLEKNLKIKLDPTPTEPFSHAGLVELVKDKEGNDYGIFRVQHRRSSSEVHEDHPNGTHPEKRGRKPFTLSESQQKKLDWHRTNGELAKIVGCSMMTIIRLRKHLGIPPVSRGRPAGH